MQNEVFTVLQNVSNVFSLINGKKENAFEHTGLIAPSENVFNQAATILKEMGYTVKQEEVSDNGCCFYFNDYFIAGKNGAYFQMLYNGNALTLDNIDPEDEEGEAVLSQLRVVNDSLLLLLGQ